MHTDGADALPGEDTKPSRHGLQVFVLPGLNSSPAGHAHM